MMADEKKVSIAELKSSLTTGVELYAAPEAYLSALETHGATEGDIPKLLEMLRAYVALRNAAPVLLEIAAAALALKEAGTEELREVIRLVSEAKDSGDYSAARTLAPRVEEKRIAALKSLDAALAKVRP